MSWLLPSALGVAAAAAIVVVALHFIARSKPLAEALPTARFVPNRPVHAKTRSFGLTDLLLLLARVAAVAALGLAVAGPMLGRRGRVSRILMVDHSRAVANAGEVRDSVRRIASTADIVVTFDSAARVRSLASLDSLRTTGAQGSLSAAIAAATRRAVVASSEADSLELVLISPLVQEEFDAATSKMRAAWPGKIRLVPVAAVDSRIVKPRVEIRADANDAVAAGLSLMGVVAPEGSVRLVRTAPTRDDSLWAAGAGHVLVHWPARDDVAGWKHRASIDAIGGVSANGASVVARFPRLWVVEGDAVARWSDGEPAAVERAVGNGCMRDVAVLIDESSDLTLRAPFRRFASELIAPCGGALATAPVDSGARASLAGGSALAAATSVRDRTIESSPWTPWLLALAALLLIGELALRRSQRAVA
jgi:hypothetical protein